MSRCWLALRMGNSALSPQQKLAVVNTLLLASTLLGQLSARSTSAFLPWEAEEPGGQARGFESEGWLSLNS